MSITVTTRRLAGMACVVALAAALGPYVRTPTGGHQVDLNRSGSVLVVERIFDGCEAVRKSELPSFRGWIPEEAARPTAKVSVKTGEVSEDIGFSNESCRSMNSLKKIGSGLSCIMECSGSACLVATTPQSDGHFGSSSLTFLDASGKVVFNDNFTIERREVRMPGTFISASQGDVRVHAPYSIGGTIRGMAYFLPSDQPPSVLAFEGSDASAEIPSGANSYLVFLQRSHGNIEINDLHVGTRGSRCIH